MLRALLSTWLCICAPIAAQADSTPLTYDRITLATDAAIKVPSDLMQVGMFAESERKNAARAAEEVNGLVTQAAAIIARYPAVKRSLLSYTTQPVYQSQSIVAWRVRQTLQLESTDMDALSQLTGELQALLGTDQISFDVTRETRLMAEQSLIRNALERFHERAKLVADSMKAMGYRVVRADIQTGRQMPNVRYRMAMEQSADIAAGPNVASGEQEVQVTVNGEIELERK